MLLKLVSGWLGKGLLAKVVTACLILLATFVVARLVRIFTARKSVNPRTNLARGILYWGVVLTGAFIALESVGYDPGPLLVTGGLVSVAVGFASQTSLSNLIGGLFLAADEPFKVGDYVKVGEHEGLVLSVDPLSTKLRTVQNVFVRIPNETLLKAVIHNFSRYRIRRLDVAVHVPLDTDIDALQAALMNAARQCEVVLVEPPPFVQIEALGELTMRAQLRVWIGEGDVLGARSALSRSVNDVLRAAGIGLGAGAGVAVAASTAGAPGVGGAGAGVRVERR